MISTTARLDQYWADELGCTRDDLYAGRVAVRAPRHREGPRWMGWLVPLEVIVPGDAPPGSGVISVTPFLDSTLRTFLRGECDLETCLPPEGKTLVHFAHDYMPSTLPKYHVILHCPPGCFQPSADVLPVEILSDHDLHAEWYRYHFDGPVFVARGNHGEIASWAAIKVKSPDVWEMAVATEPAYRHKGLARSVVTHATRAALDAGKVALYLHDVTNYASSKVCGALGYQFYGHELTFEAGRVAPSHKRPSGY